VTECSTSFLFTSSLLVFVTSSLLVFVTSSLRHSVTSSLRHSVTAPARALEQGLGVVEKDVFDVRRRRCLDCGQVRIDKEYA